MTGWLIGAITLILVVLIVGRRCSKVFRRKSEEPKYQFLANIGIPADETDPPLEQPSSPSLPTKESTHEHRKS